MTSLSTLSAMLLLNLSSIDANKTEIEIVEQVVVPTLSVASENVFLFERTVELINQTVTFGDMGMFDQVRINQQTLINNMKSLQANKQSTEDMIHYFVLSEDIAKNMVAGDLADFDNKKILARAQLEKNLKSHLAEKKQTAEQDLRTSIGQLQQNSKSALDKMIVASLIGTIILVVASHITANKIGNAAMLVASGLEKLSTGEGSLSTKLPILTSDELGAVSKNYNHFAELLKSTVLEVQSTLPPLNNFSSQLHDEMEDAKKATDSQVDDVGTVCQSIKEMESSVEDIAHAVNCAVEAMIDAKERVKAGQKSVIDSVAKSRELKLEMTSVTEKISQLASNVKNVTSIVDVITTIAEQTNLLALNAAIEAARAGEQGRGFAVVADEVRQLAQKTADATSEIRDNISELEIAANVSVEAVSSSAILVKENLELSKATGETIKKISTEIDAIDGMSIKIAAATDQQMSVAHTAISNMARLNDSFVHVISILDGLVKISSGLTEQTNRVSTAMSSFKI